MKDWKTFCERFLAARKGSRYRSEIKPLKDFLNKKENKARLTPEDFEWLGAALSDEDQKQFVVFLAVEVFGGVPKKLYKPMIRAAVLEKNPSLNNSFIKPCLFTFGHRNVIGALLDYLKNGSNREKAGAVRALYWALHELKSPADDDIKQKTKALFLTEFVENPNVDVRRSIVAQLETKKDAYPDELQPLVAQAIAIARASDDEYIRHRIEVQLGSEKIFKPLPPLSKK